MTNSNAGSAAAGRFALHHRWDRNFYLVMVALVWLAILRGFGGELAKHFANHAPAFPLIVHVHALVFVSWLILFTVQLFLIRVRKVTVHMALGLGLVWLAGVMVIIGPATAFTVQRRAMGGSHFDPAFLAIQLVSIVAFAGLTTAAIIWRKRLAAHKRLILLGTIFITDAGFARWFGDSVVARFGFNVWSFGLLLYAGPDVLILLVGAYDLVTRRRLHPAYVAGFAWALACQATVLSLYFSPGWAQLARRLIATWPYGSS